MVGQHIGKYRVTQQIGRGGMGTVYAAIDETLHRDVAIKVLNAELLLAELDEPVAALHARQLGHVSDKRLDDLVALLGEARTGNP